MLDESRNYNDYDYALVHLFEKEPEYYNFFKVSKTLGREILLDNSIFELGHAFDPIKFAKYVFELRPTYYVVPDVLEDSQQTCSSFNKFTLNYPDLPGLKIGVVQGKTYQELVECYRFMAKHADYIAISFDYSWYQTITFSNVGCKLQQQMKGRRRLIKMLIDDGIWDHSKPHHLLGCSLAQEFKDYKFISSIRSVDTSNPIVAGLVGKRYYKGIGLLDKPKTLLADLINSPVDDELMRDIIYNVDEFKNLLRS
tara:strand:+ start:1332 stop:2093 length:762 start_codon:yes stop_codon:yes gene_type:complete